MKSRNDKSKFKMFALCILFCIQLISYSQKSEDKMLHNKIDSLVENYCPVYYFFDDGDTMLVSRIPLPPEDINDYLLKCASIKEYSPIKYALVVLIKQNREYIYANNSDYVIDEMEYDNNGFVSLLSSFISDLEGELNWPLYAGDVIVWFKERKHLIEDWDYVEKFINKNISKEYFKIRKVVYQHYKQ